MKLANCIGCGAKLQQKFPSLPGFLPEISNKISKSELVNKAVLNKKQLKVLLKPEKTIVCKRCHDLRHNSHCIEPVYPDKNKLFGLLSARPTGIICHITDTFSLPRREISELGKKTILIINKSDIFSPPIDRPIYSSFDAIHATSAKTGEGIFSLIDSINKLADEKDDIYFVGNANTGKSSIINMLIKLSGTKTENVFTTSTLPGTTIDAMRAPTTLFSTLLKNANSNTFLVDTPGLLDDKSVLPMLKHKEVKQTLVSKPLKPRGYESVELDASVFFGALARFDYIQGHRPISVAMFASHQIPIHISRSRNSELVYQKHWGDFLKPPGPFASDEEKEQRLREWPNMISERVEIIGKDDGEWWDMGIRGVGWMAVKVYGPCSFDVYTPGGTGVFLRKSLVVPKWDKRNKRWFLKS